MNKIIIVSSAEYGRMKLGRCITKPNEFMGCTNDVLPLIDKWCSGRGECDVVVPNPELEKLNENCLEVLIKYLLVTYSCISGKGYNLFTNSLAKTVDVIKLHISAVVVMMRFECL